MTGEQQESHHDESTEGTHAEPRTAPDNRAGEAAERLTGINVESPRVVALGVVVSIALAAAVWLRPNRAVSATVAAFTAAALVLDIIEINHQIGADRIGLAALACVIAHCASPPSSAAHTCCEPTARQPRDRHR